MKIRYTMTVDDMQNATRARRWRTLKPNAYYMGDSERIGFRVSLVFMLIAVLCSLFLTFTQSFWWGVLAPVTGLFAVCSFGIHYAPARKRKHVLRNCWSVSDACTGVVMEANARAVSFEGAQKHYLFDWRDSGVWENALFFAVKCHTDVCYLPKRAMTPEERAQFRTWVAMSPAAF